MVSEEECVETNAVWKDIVERKEVLLKCIEGHAEHIHVWYNLHFLPGCSLLIGPWLTIRPPPS